MKDYRGGRKYGQKEGASSAVETHRGDVVFCAGPASSGRPPLPMCFFEPSPLEIGERLNQYDARGPPGYVDAFRSTKEETTAMPVHVSLISIGGPSKFHFLFVASEGNFEMAGVLSLVII